MDDSALQTRLERIERRQSVVLILLAGPSLLAGGWLLVRAVPGVTGWHVAAGGRTAGLT